MKKLIYAIILCLTLVHLVDVAFGNRFMTYSLVVAVFMLITSKFIEADAV